VVPRLLSPLSTHLPARLNLARPELHTCEPGEQSHLDTNSCKAGEYTAAAGADQSRG
jgi:hypothetical protein